MERYFQNVETYGMTIRTVFFDMGGTIETFGWTPELRIKATSGIRKRLAAAGIHLDLTDKRLYKIISAGLDAYHELSLQTMEELTPQRIWKEYILADYSVDPEKLSGLAEELMLYIETHYYERVMRPEVPAVLDAIQNMGYKIGLISNVNSRGQVPQNLNQYGVIQYFNPIVLSSEYKRRKPDPSIFHYAARLSNSPTSECIYIGDRISRDIVGAKRAGFKLAIQIHHDFNHGEIDEGAVPDLILNDMNELLVVLQEEIKSCKELKKDNSSVDTIRAILFDADGVLYYRKNKDQELDSFIKQYGLKHTDIPESAIDQLRHQAFIGQITFEQYKTAVLNLHGITDPCLVSRGIQKVIEEKDKIHFFKNTLETLNILKDRNLYLGIVTDTAQPLHVKINKLERGGIGHVWDSITPSSEVGVQKPDPKIYQLALQQLGIKSNQAVFVGHKSIELEGARNVGMRTIAFNYENGAKADFYIDNFSDLAQLAILN
jgi:putative hydrolase of the HAD superfamily